jgi:hypothetical protein
MMTLDEQMIDLVALTEAFDKAVSATRAEIFRLREALLNIATHQDCTDELADIALEALIEDPRQ